MTMSDKLATFSERKLELKRELQEIAVTKRESDNAALAELESALLAELGSVEQKIQQINTYLERCHDVSRSDATDADPLPRQ
ncbi:MAG: hypothetical protein MI923_07480 [Phycisphaerales bacterium]|nr:hypothetical protein [Phycisphaerales bacterium]